jgi:hypothetical protein
MLSSWSSCVFARLTLAGAHSAKLESYEGSATKTARALLLQSFSLKDFEDT